ncbi:MAG TPA: histidine phosphatase family protein [Bryobacteraceae bacterium]|nr:histidine phosphatase family protein [Bryobacteraceae bacterium]
MSSLYLIRHGQAGTRGNYDALSELGHQQARLLGGHLAAQRIVFKAFIAGCLHRQQQTAAAVWRAYREAGVPVPDIVSDPQWNEFDLTAVFTEYAPLLMATDPRFKQDYEEMLRKLEDESSPLHHSWTDCDTQVMRAWMEGRFPARTTESWEAFRRRVLERRAALGAYQSGDAVAIFTSATPIALWVASSLDVTDGHIMRIGGAMYNTAVNTFRLRGEEVTLFSFNGVPHLDEPSRRTFR